MVGGAGGGLELDVAGTHADAEGRLEQAAAYCAIAAAATNTAGWAFGGRRAPAAAATIGGPDARDCHARLGGRRPAVPRLGERPARVCYAPLGASSLRNGSVTRNGRPPASGRRGTATYPASRFRLRCVGTALPAAPCRPFRPSPAAHAGPPLPAREAASGHIAQAVSVSKHGLFEDAVTEGTRGRPNGTMAHCLITTPCPF